jgi:hypothetical protein
MATAPIPLTARDVASTLLILLKFNYFMIGFPFLLEGRPEPADLLAGRLTLRYRIDHLIESFSSSFSFSSS